MSFVVIKKFNFKLKNHYFLLNSVFYELIYLLIRKIITNIEDVKLKLSYFMLVKLAKKFYNLMILFLPMIYFIIGNLN